MIPELPRGSRMMVMPGGADTLILIPHEGGGLMRYGIGLFILAWLGGWTAGFYSAFSQLRSGNAPAFLFFWLIGWTLGGAMAAYWLYRIFRPAVPESLRLAVSAVAYDSGIAPVRFSSGYGYGESYRDGWRSMLPKRTRLELDRHTLQSLRLRETERGNRLTVDAGAARVELAAAATEVEREWLYRLLAKHYALSVPPVPGRG